MEAGEYCRQIEAYLCQKNDGHLVRVVGPAFDCVTQWIADGVPFKVACAGVDRYFERYYRKGRRQRPVRIDFCDADVREVFDEWRRATGLTAARHVAAGAPSDQSESTPRAGAEGALPDHARPDGDRPTPRGLSLPAHLERALRRLTQARVSGAIGPACDDLLDAVSHELDRARAAGGLRGAERVDAQQRLQTLHRELLRRASEQLTDAERAAIRHDAEEQLREFRGQLTDDRYAAAVSAAEAEGLQRRLGLPTLALA